MKIVEGYGPYCVRQFGPDGNACVTIHKGDVTECVDPPFSARKEAQCTTKVPGKEQNLYSEEELPIWATGQIVCFLLGGPETSKQKTTHGILATDVQKDSKFGTCLMANNTYNTFSSKDIWDAAKREEDPIFARGCPTSTLAAVAKSK
jgi:hypothetical protein